MTAFIWTQPTARKRHRCGLCTRVVLVGETYVRMAGLDRSAAYTYKACDHCARVASTWCRWSGEYEWDDLSIIDWLDDEYPAVLASMQARWRYPDGELLPLPFQPRCRECRCLIPGDQLWCDPCDDRRIARISGQLEAIFAEMAAA